MKIIILPLLILVFLGTEVQADVFGTGTNQFTINFVEIGNAENVADTSGYGAVDYTYRIGRSEISAGQFSKALSADSRIGNGNEGFWNRNSPNAPATYVSRSEAARFANWLTTGDAYAGVYQFNGSGVLTGINRTYRNTYNIAYVLPTENEWYKAAYYKPVNDGTYSLHASGLDTDPLRGTANGWHYDGIYGDIMWPVGYGGIEQNGTFGMTGNVWELDESVGFRGGARYSNAFQVSSAYRYVTSVESGNWDVGFRIATIGTLLPPEVDIYILAETPQIGIRWNSFPGETYQVQYSSSLVYTNWVNLGDRVLGNGTNSVFDSVDGPKTRFYRVIKQ